MDISREPDSSRSEIEISLNDALSSLQPSDRDLVLKRFFQGLSVRELAGEIGTTEDTAAKRLSRVIDRLRRHLQAQEVMVTSATLAAWLLEHAVSRVPHKVAAAISQVPQTLPASAAKAHSLNSILAKGLLTMSATKIAGGTALVVLAALLGTIALLHFRHSSSAKDDRPVQWLAPPAADAATQTAQQQIQARFLEYMEAWNSSSAPKILADLSPDFTSINRAASQQPIKTSPVFYQMRSRRRR